MTATDDMANRIMAAVERELNLPLLVEPDHGRLVISGAVGSEELVGAIMDIARHVAGDTPLDTNIDVVMLQAGEQGEFDLSEGDVGNWRGGSAGYDEDDEIEPGDFTDQEGITDPDAASGAGSSGVDLGDDPTEGDRVYTPPLDPVGSDTEVIGGFSESSLSSLVTERSSDGSYGDEAIAESVRRELREDSATNPLALDIAVRGGVVVISGQVQTMDDAEAAQSVAARVPGVREVVDQTESESGYLR